MKPKQPSRVLNEKSLLLGLDYTDIVGLAMVLMFANFSLKPFGKEVFALPITLGALICLIPIRMRYRKKIIRDFIAYHVGPKVINARKYRRDQKPE
jgi:hypothetical protein